VAKTKKLPRARDTLDRLFDDCAIRSHQMESQAFLMRLATAVANDDAIEGDLDVSQDELERIKAGLYLPDHPKPPKASTVLRMYDGSGDRLFIHCCPCGSRNFIDSEFDSVHKCPKCHNGPIQVTHDGKILPMVNSVRFMVRDNSYSCFGHFTELKETDERIEHRNGLKKIRYHWTTDRFVHQYHLTTFIFNKKSKKIYKVICNAGKFSVQTPNEIPVMFCEKVLEHLGIDELPSYVGEKKLGAWIRLMIRYPNADPISFAVQFKRYVKDSVCKSFMTKQRRRMDKMFLKKAEK